MVAKIWIWEDLLEDYVILRVNQAVSSSKMHFPMPFSSKKNTLIQQLSPGANQKAKHFRNIVLCAIFLFLGVMFAQKN
jgi:hypothetical protein